MYLIMGFIYNKHCDIILLYFKEKVLIVILVPLYSLTRELIPPF